MGFSWDREKLYKILLARDHRYDGRFYIGVKTTGIYCRPICPARPLLKNVLFYRSAAEAENAGYRPCLRCRPELSPSSVQWQGTAAVVGRALNLIASGDLDESSLEEFSEKLGMSDRHLRRLFEEHLGATPMDVALSKRLHLAKQLLSQTALPVTEIAFASGFKSVRRFNDAFKKKFKASPSGSRKTLTASSGTSASSDAIEIDLPYIAPFDWDYLYRFLKNHGATGIEHFEDDKYSRVFSIDKKIGVIEVKNNPEEQKLNLKIQIEDYSELRNVIEKTKSLFDLRANPHHIFDDIQTQNKKVKHYEKSGIRIPGAWNPFETAICIILGQLVSVEQAHAKIKKLIELYGTKIKNPPREHFTHLFPSPEVLMTADLFPVGMTRVRAEAIRTLAREVFNKRIDLSPSADLEQTRKQLLEITGIGPWTVEMIAMRCLGDTNAMPEKDLIIKRAIELNRWTHHNWSPWKAYVSLSIWKKYAGTLSKIGTKKAGLP